MKKFYIRINGELMEVDYKVYREYYYGKRKEKYFMFDLKWGGIKQKGGKNKLVREISLESLWEKGIEISTDDTVWSIIEKEIDLEKLYVAIHRLDIWEKIVLQKIFWEGLSEKY